jgi:hypothetical protein
VLTTASNLVAEATSAAGAAVTFTRPTATDLVDGGLPVTCDHASGAIYPVGVTTVICTATDAHGNGAMTSFTITVQVTATPPVIGKVPGTNALNQLIVYATTSTVTTVKYTLPTAKDRNGVTVPVTCTPASGTKFPIGKTTVTCKATDAGGRTGSATFTAWVQVQVALTASDGTIFRQPIEPNGSSIFRLGSTVETKFKLAGPSAPMEHLVAHISIVKTSNAIEGTHQESVCNDTADIGDLFRYKSSTGEYVFNLSTRNLTEGTYRISADLGDGIPHTVRISLKR